MSLFTPTRAIAAGVVLTGLALALPIDTQIGPSAALADPMADTLTLPEMTLLAQAPSGPPHDRANGPRGPMPGHMGPNQGQWEHVEGRLAYAKAELAIKPEQEANWNKLAEVLRQHAAAQRQLFDQRARAHEQAMAQIQAQRQADPNATPARPQRPSAIDQLAMNKDRMDRASAFMTDLMNAAKPLYAQLDDKQKAVADKLIRRRA